MITEDGRQLYTAEDVDARIENEVRLALDSAELKRADEQLDAHLQVLETEQQFWNDLEQALTELQGGTDFRALRVEEQRNPSAIADYLEELAEKLREQKEDDE